MNFFARNKRTLCMVLVLCSVFVFTGCGGPGSSEDPNWKKTHVTVTSAEDAVKQFGSDLLLDKLVLTNGYGKPYTEFILEHTGESSEAWKDRKNWRMLTANVNYGSPGFDPEQAHTSLAIFTNEHDAALTGSERYPGDGYEALLRGSTATQEINGVFFVYRAFAEQKIAYSFCAEFKYNGYVYFFQSYSNKYSDLAWDTLHQMLDS